MMWGNALATYLAAPHSIQSNLVIGLTKYNNIC